MPNKDNNDHSDNVEFRFKKSGGIKVAVLGGGIGGCMTALKLAEEFPDVHITIFEKNKELLFGTSNRTPGRMSLGFHYIHPPSAITCLHSTIDFIKHFNPLCTRLMLGQALPAEHSLRNGRYFIVKESLFSAEEIIETYDGLSKEYARLVEEDGKNKLFGEPNQFYKCLDLEEYKDDVNLEHVEIAIETHEHLLDWPNFREFLLDKIATCSNIKVLTETEVKDISYLYTQSFYVIHAKKENSLTHIEHPVDFVINATWEWVDYFNAKVGYYRLPDEIRTNRAKALVKVKLPEELKEKNSMFFCMGAFCMFSNLGNGYGLITYAPATNMSNSTSLVPEKSYLNFINGFVSAEKKQKIASDIIRGVSQFIPAMAKAEMVEVRFGTVQVEGTVDINDPESKMHERDYSGLKLHEHGFISLACMKLLYGYSNASSAVTLFGEFKRKIFPTAEKIEELTSAKLSPDSKTGKAVQNVKISLLSGVCFAWFKKACPEESHDYDIDLETFCSNFFRKIDLNKEFDEKNKRSHLMGTSIN